MVKICLRILLQLLLAGSAAAAAVWCYLKGMPYGAVIALFLFLVLVYRMVSLFRDILHDFNDFVQALHYRDFSQHFSIKRAPSHLKFFRRGFNEIVTGYKRLSNEKELQYQYLQNVLELVDTAILAFEPGTGEVIWINNQMKNLIGVPGLKNLKRLERQLPVLNEAFYKISPGAQSIIKVDILHRPHKLLLTSNNFITNEQQMKLIALQNVEEALDVTETEAWNKLLRVLTHEIMNSIAPISSLANTLQDRLGQLDNHKISESDFKDLQDGMQTIRSRSDGLMRFSTSYRNLNKIGQINLSEFYVRDLFENLASLMQPGMTSKAISLELILKNPNLKMQADRQLLEQVMINLLLNAIDAVRESPAKRVTIAGEKNQDGQTILKVKDSGKGMDEQIMERIFIPFFSTKKSGSGIGLSLCKQIMLLHKGNIQVKSTPDEGTSFRLQFPAQ
ncbi:sensor histidine kinase [Arachidicoccus terrestris]|uniref:sensor histidine kinase n=1 Tax=Arachidicoccus terrestris TaxID=2875539 RepID=UPI001CC461B5|nr:HAMP domain-containing sensor histidine kinase [Arachidicoccus terrestris]UAY56822.1 HAMP domain-containing histidine kinase [Arachidicoccus terrestris]